MGHLAWVVDGRGASLKAGHHGTVTLTHADGRTQRVGMRALASVVLHGDVQISTGLLQALAGHGVALAVLPLRGRGTAVGFSQLPHRHAALRHAQHLAYADSAHRIELARAVVQAKLSGFAAFIRAHTADRDDAVMPAMVQTRAAVDTPALMGVEGAASARHFERLGRLYQAAQGGWTFNGRTRRPPLDPPNALMSLCYTLAQSEAARLALHAGMDVQLGFLHALHRDRQSLALDLIEPARPVIDGWVLSLLTRRDVLRRADFSGARSAGTSNGNLEAEPVRLTADGRSKFYPLWFSEGLAMVRAPMRSLLAQILKCLRVTG